MPGGTMMMSEHVASGAFLLLDVTPPSVESGRTVSDSLATLTADKLVLESLGVDMRFGVLRQVRNGRARNGHMRSNCHTCASSCYSTSCSCH